MMRTRGVLAVAVTLLISGGCASTDTKMVSESTLDRIKASKTIIFGHRQSSVPFSFVSPQGRPAGFTVDLCDRVAADLRQDLQMPDLNVKWVPVTVESRVQALRDKAIDLECG